ncbi:MAG: cysteine--tRNA ligase [Candidatus Lambdaproteobacteria bacterium]|nr:cysteine--tRNA ligase [Candidatus Lambdaproteobacteria bacterium]
MDLQLFNTLSRRKERFVPLRPGHVGIYTCGPTVYGPAHIGNLRSYIFPDILKKTLRRLGYQVRHVINITDVGHLTSNEDTGEDKMERAARQSARSAWDIAAEFTRRYLADLARLNVEPPDVMPRATDHIAEQIAHIRTLEAKGFTYRTEDGIYFDTTHFERYGRMARLHAGGLQEGSRVEMGTKRHKTDFALWKFSPPDVKRQMEWDSPWGRGFPGWHIECSAMSMKYLGDEFDIHTGGSDHIPVHHTNEIAQSEAATGRPFVHYWLHGEHLVLGEDERMGKSEGNLVLLDDLVAQGYEPLSFRYLALNNHYRKYLQFSWQALKAADTALMGLRRLLAETGLPAPESPPPAEREASAPGWRLLAELADDLNTPKALATLWTVLRDGAMPAADKVALAAAADAVLSLNLFDASRLDAAREVPPEIQALAQARWNARGARDFAEADRLRDEIRKAGYVVRDGKDGFEVVKA